MRRSCFCVQNHAPIGRGNLSILLGSCNLFKLFSKNSSAAPKKLNPLCMLWFSKSAQKVRLQALPGPYSHCLPSSSCRVAWLIPILETFPTNDKSIHATMHYRTMSGRTFFLAGCIVEKQADQRSIARNRFATLQLLFIKKASFIRFKLPVMHTNLVVILSLR